MTAFRIPALVLALGLLTACDEPPKPPAPVPTPPRTEARQPSARVPAEPAVTASKPAVNGKPAATQSPPPKSQPAPAKVQSPAVAKARPVKPQPLPPVKLDLRLPAELVEQMEFEPAVPAEPLLPPLFGDKPPEPGPFQLNGRLITNEQREDYWESVEGAELQFEFRN